jgi:hypothetical protein
MCLRARPRSGTSPSNPSHTRRRSRRQSITETRARLRWIGSSGGSGTWRDSTRSEGGWVRRKTLQRPTRRWHGACVDHLGIREDRDVRGADAAREQRGGWSRSPLDPRKSPPPFSRKAESPSRLGESTAPTRSDLNAALGCAGRVPPVPRSCDLRRRNPRSRSVRFR